MTNEYTREQLVAFGMSEAQINAIMSAQNEAEGSGCNGQDSLREGAARKFVSHSDAAAAGRVYNLPVMSASDSMKVTTIADLHMYGQGKVVRFPDFAEGQPFVARVRRPSMLVLAKQGKIPNTLLAAAGELFTKGGGGMDADNADMLGQVYDICKIICSAALLEPTMEDIETAGMELSDDQMMAIFNYTQSGVKALESFRKE